MIDFSVIGSSSAGNSYVLRTKNQSLLLECGVHIKRIKSALKHDLSKVAGCLVTHEHKDHSKSIQQVMEAGIDVYSSSGTLDACNVGKSHHRAHVLVSEKQINIGEFTVLPFDVQHDASEPFGFLIYHPEFGKFLFTTDTYYIKYKFKGLNFIAVEVNYSKAILDRKEREGHLQPILKKRLLTSHFSLENFKKFLQANDLSQLKEIYLLHLSDSHSDEALFKSEIEKFTGKPVKIARK